MAETFPTFQWGSKVPKMDQHGPNTRAFRSNDIVRWSERMPKTLQGLSLESAGIGIVNLANQKTAETAPAEVRIPRVKKIDVAPKGNYILLKKYDGYISSRSTNTFTARLYEKFGDYPVLEAEFDLEELLEVDRHLAVEGAALVWTIGYHDADSRRRESVIYLRRRPGWNQKEIDQAKQATSELLSDIEWK